MSQAGEAFRSVAASRSLRRLELAALGSFAGDWAYGVALAVYAYGQGGAYAVGLSALARMGVAALVAAPASALADRFDRRRVMVAADLSRMVIVTLAAVFALTGAPAVAVYVCAVVASSVGTVFEPARAAIMPAVATTPEQLTAANVVHSTIESVSAFAGPAIGGLLVAAFDPGVVFLVDAVTFAWSAALLNGVRASVAPSDEGDESDQDSGVLAGFRLMWRDPHLRLLQGLFTLQTFVCGFLNVFTVVIAFQLLQGGAVDAGLLDAAAGVGGVAGAVAAAALIGRRLSTGFVIGLALWGIPIAVIGIAPSRPLALAMMAVLGVANTVIDVAALTLLQRTVPDQVMGRVFGAVETLFVASVGLGSLLAPVALDVLGTNAALIVVGLLLPAAAIIAWRPLARLDAATPERADVVSLLGAVPFLAPLSRAAIERLAASSHAVAAPAGTVVIEAGAVGDRFYVVESGTLSVTAGEQRADDLGPGTGFGEIALLRDVPRTATVTAVTDCDLVAIDREPFLEAVTGFDESGRAAELVITARLARLHAITIAG